MTDALVPAGAGGRRPTARASTPESRRRLLLHLIVHEIRQQHTGTVLGMAWTVLQPLMLLGAYFFLFTVLRVPSPRYGSLGQVAVILSGIVPWFYFIHSFSSSLGTLQQHAPLVRQINFPIEVLPFANVGIYLVDFVIGLALLLGLTISQGWTGWSIVMLLPTTVLFTAFLVGLTALMAPLGAMLRDLRTVLPVILRLGLWISPILYLPGAIPQRFQWVMYANPLTYFIGLLRFSTLGRAFGNNRVALLAPGPTFAIAAASTVVVTLAGYLSWKYVRRVAVDYL